MIYKICIGYDDAQPISYNVAQHSVLRHASEPVSITPLILETLPIQRRGLTKFSFSRFLIPYLMNYRGWALWIDADIIFVDDPIKVWRYADPSKAVIIAQDVPDFERSAMMLINCGHPDNRVLTPQYIDTATNLHEIGWTKEIGGFPANWCHLVGYAAESNDVKGIHYTCGIPGWAQTADCEHQEKWVTELRAMNSTKSWTEIMGKSRHAVQTDEGLVPIYKVTPPPSLSVTGDGIPLLTDGAIRYGNV
jgi:hypothetical protein